MKIAGRIVVVSCSALLAGQAAAFVPWNNPNYALGNYWMSNGGSDNGYMGDPVVNGLGSPTLRFMPDQFSASSSGVGSSSITDRIVFDLVDAPGMGYTFTSINIAENGVYSTTAGGQVLSTPVLTVTNLTTLAVFSTNLSVTYSSGIWVALGGVNLTGWSSGESLRVEIFNTLTATTFAAGDTAMIDKSTVQRDLHSALEVSIVPAPSAVAAFSMALVLRRRRRA